MAEEAEEGAGEPIVDEPPVDEAEAKAVAALDDETLEAEYTTSQEEVAKLYARLYLLKREKDARANLATFKEANNLEDKDMDAIVQAHLQRTDTKAGEAA